MTLLTGKLYQAERTWKDLQLLWINTLNDYIELLLYLLFSILLKIIYFIIIKFKFRILII